MLYEAGLPPEMLSVITGDPREIADEILTNPDVDLVTFTGGVPIGKYIAAKAVYKRQVLELGGNDPIIVMDDADVDEGGRARGQRIVQELGPALHCGQAHPRAREGRRRVHRRPARTHQGVDLRRPARSVGGHGHGDRRGARRSGSRRWSTTRSPAGHASCMATCARARCTRRRCSIASRPEMDVVRHETFGPVSPVMTFKDVDEAIRIVNSTAYGLSSGVCTNRLDDIMRFVRELEVGSVNVWEVPGYRLEVTPFGGIKDSGLGYKEGVQEAMKSFTNVKTYSLPW